MESPGFGSSRRLEPGLNTELKLSVQVPSSFSYLCPCPHPSPFLIFVLVPILLLSLSSSFILYPSLIYLVLVLKPFLREAFSNTMITMMFSSSIPMQSLEASLKSVEGPAMEVFVIITNLLFIFAQSS